jgi:hypothetical protein
MSRVLLSDRAQTRADVALAPEEPNHSRKNKQGTTRSGGAQSLFGMFFKNAPTQLFAFL